MKEKWTDDMQRRLDGHKMAPPPGLWEGICERMGIEPESVPAGKPAAVRRWYWAAAAAVLALVGFFAYYHLGNEEPVAEDREAVMVSNEAERIASELEMPVSPKMPVIDRQPSHSLLAVQSHKKDTQASAPDDEADPVQSEEMAAVEKPGDAERNHGDRSRDSVGQNHGTVPMIPDALSYPEPFYVATRKSSDDVSRWTIGLNASGGLLAANNSVNTGRLYYAQSMTGSAYFPYATNSSSYTLTEHVAKHRLPVRFGLSLHYQLTPRLALLSGVGYTRLYSEFSLPSSGNISYSQRLHYIGIPVGVAWQLWSAKHFSFYLSGGAMVEKCVSIGIDGVYTGRKPWQWSVNGAVGAEYTLMPQLGVYLEPSLGYYFSDGTPLEHYYKEHPLAPSIEFGLRMHFGR